MAEITARRQGEMIQTLFQILKGEPEGMQAKDAIAAVEGKLQLTDFEKSTFPNNPELVRFPKILRFSTINSVKAGWLLKKAGTWTLTDEGKAALDEYADPEALFKESGRLYKKWKAGSRRREGTTRTVRTKGCSRLPPWRRLKTPLGKRSAAQRRSRRKITLIDGEKLLDLWVEHYGHLEEDGKSLLPVRPVYFLDAEST